MRALFHWAHRVFLATTYPNTTDPLNRLVLAQDTGGAIKGAVPRRSFLGFWRTGRDTGGIDEAERSDVGVIPERRGTRLDTVIM